MKPKLTKADQDAYTRAASLGWNQKVQLAGKNAYFKGVYENGDICFLISGRNQHVPAGDPRLLRLEC